MLNIHKFQCGYELLYSQLRALLEIQISPVFMQIQHLVETNPADMNVLSLKSAATGTKRLSIYLAGAGYIQ